MQHCVAEHVTTVVGNRNRVGLFHNVAYSLQAVTGCYIAYYMWN